MHFFIQKIKNIMQSKNWADSNIGVSPFCLVHPFKDFEFMFIAVFVIDNACG